MGASVSKQQLLIDTINKTVSDVLLENTSSCGINNSILQSMNFSNFDLENCDLSFSNINQTSNSSIQLKCINSNINEIDSLNKIKNNLINNFKSEVSGINFGFNININETINKKVNEIVNNINIRNISQCVNNSITQQIMDFGKIKIKNCKTPVTFNNISQHIINTQVADCINKNENITKIVNDLVNETKQDFSTNTKGLELNLNLIIIICIIIGGALILFKLGMFNYVFTNKYFIIFIILIITSLILWYRLK